MMGITFVTGSAQGDIALGNEILRNMAVTAIVILAMIGLIHITKTIASKIITKKTEDKKKGRKL